MAAQDGLHHRVVGHVRQRGAVDRGIVRQGRERLDPHGVVRVLGALPREEERLRDVAHVEGPLEGLGAGLGDVQCPEGLPQGGQRLRVRDALGHLVLVLQALGGLLEGRDHRQDGLALLVRVDPARGEGAAVPHALHAEGDGQLDVPAPQEVRVQGVDGPARVHGAHGGHRGLGEHLPAVHARPGRGDGAAHEDVLRGAGATAVREVEHPDQRGHGFLGGIDSHGPHSKPADECGLIEP